jgi:copper chaperone
MRQTYEVKNVKCGGCAGTLKKSLRDEFGEVEVDLDVMPRKITLDIGPEKEEALKLALRKIGYPLVTDELGTFATIETKAKSFVSCAIGRMDSEND